MKKIFIVMMLAITLCFSSNVKAKTNSLNDVGASLGIKYNMTLKCADSTYIEDAFWGCVKKENLVKCGDTNIPSPIPPLTRTIVTFIKIAAPLVLIIMGMIDIVKAVTASDEKKMKEAQSKFVKRLIPAALIFLTVTIIQLLVGIIADSTAESDSLSNCIDCMISDESKCGTN